MAFSEAYTITGRKNLILQYQVGSMTSCFLCSHPTFNILRLFKTSARASSEDIADAAARVAESMESKDTRQKQQNLAVAMQMGALQELLASVANDNLSESCLAAVLRICTLLMQSESIRDSFSTTVRISNLTCCDATLGNMVLQCCSASDKQAGHVHVTLSVEPVSIDAPSQCLGCVKSRAMCPCDTLLRI